MKLLREELALVGLDESESKLSQNPGNKTKEITKLLHRARIDLYTGKAALALERVEKFGENQEAAKFARGMLNELDRLEKLIWAYLLNNQDLSRQPPKVK